MSGRDDIGRPVRLPAAPTRLSNGILPHLAAAITVAAATLVGYLLHDLLALRDVALVLLMAVIVSALRFGLGPAMTALVLCIASYDFFLVSPVYSFGIADPGDLLAISCFIAVSLIVSSLVAQTRRHAHDMEQRVRTITTLYDFSRQAVGLGDFDALLRMITAQLQAAAGAGIVLLLPGPGGLETHAAMSDRQLTPRELDAATRCWQQGRPIEPAQAGHPLLLALRTPHGTNGVVAILATAPLAARTRRLLDALIDQAAIAIERIRLTQDVETARLQTESERLRSALLTSVSHDLRTPLAYIIGALSTLRRFGGKLEPSARTELMTTAQEEAERLNRHIGNLLDMTRLESGEISAPLDRVAIDEVISAALSRAHPLLRDRPVELVMPEIAPLVAANFPLLEQMLFNLLDNAAKYAPAGTLLTITAMDEGDLVTIAVADEGAGLPEAALDSVFDRFTRLAPERQPGVGLGLAICRGFATAMGGNIRAANRRERSGAVFTIQLQRAA